jgi:hypothetical protein
MYDIHAERFAGFLVVLLPGHASTLRRKLFKFVLTSGEFRPVFANRRARNAAV